MHTEDDFKRCKHCEELFLIEGLLEEPDICPECEAKGVRQCYYCGEWCIPVGVLAETQELCEQCYTEIENEEDVDLSIPLVRY